MNTKSFFRKLFCNVFKVYTPTQVREMFLHYQYEMAQEIIGNRGEKRTTPIEFYNQNKKF